MADNGSCMEVTGTPTAGRFIVETPLQVNDLGLPPFGKFQGAIVNDRKEYMYMIIYV